MNQFIWVNIASLIACIIVCWLPIKAQHQLWGMAKHGGEASLGSIYRLDLGSNTMVEEFSFPTENPGIHPNGALELGPDGYLYGLCREGGRYNAGLIFRVDTNGSQYTVVHDFKEGHGRVPRDALLLGSDGLLYGLSGRPGILFSFDPVQESYQVLAQLDGSLKGGLIQASNGKLYGLSYSTNAVFSWDIAQDSLEIEAVFGSSVGKRPTGTLMEASDGRLYGFFEQGGLHNSGGIFVFDPVSKQIDVLHDFLHNSINQNYPAHPMVEVNGVLLGTTFVGGPGGRGAIFSLPLMTGEYELLWDFFGTGIDRPNSGLIYHGGLLYGTCWASPAFGGLGAIFSFDPTDTMTSPTVLHSFPSHKEEGFFPLGGLRIIGNRLFGTCTGAKNGHGSLFHYDLSDSSFEGKLILSDMAEGGFPVGRLVEGPDGLFYGMTEEGGIDEGGSIFSFDRISKEFRLRQSFTQTSGIEPKGSLLFASDGMAYGMTYHRAQYGDGALFRFDPSEDSLTILHEFDSHVDGEFPVGYLIEGIGSHVYGITSSGILFSFDRDVKQLTILHQFEDSSGLAPVPGILLGNDGHLYGATYIGGQQGMGVLYQYKLTDSTYHVLHHFDGQGGRLPAGCPVEIEPGLLAGLTKSGGAFGGGVLYSYDLDANHFQTLHDFDPLTEANNANGEIVLAEQDQIFGVLSESFLDTRQGGIFRFDKSDSSFSILHRFDETVGHGIFDHNFPESFLTVQGFPTAIDLIQSDKIVQEVKVFPNPSPSNFTLSFERKEKMEVYLQLSTIQGQVLKEKKIREGIGKVQESFDLDGYPSGIYLLRIISNGSSQARQLIKI